MGEELSRSGLLEIQVSLYSQQRPNHERRKMNEALFRLPMSAESPETRLADQIPPTGRYTVLNTCLGTIRVHAENCPNIALETAEFDGTPETVPGRDQRSIVAQYSSDLLDEGATLNEVAADFLWLGCCEDLPWDHPDAIAEELCAATCLYPQEHDGECAEYDLARLSPLGKRMLRELTTGGPWHPQTRLKVIGDGLVKQTTSGLELTHLGELARDAL
ncbi:hypothetical protein ACWFMI_14965 [Nocardiopsis terrae]